MAPKNHDTSTPWYLYFMPSTQIKQSETELDRIKLGTVRVSPDAYDAIVTIQHQFRRETGKALPLWKLIDAAIIAYARQGSNNSGG
jgi:hypothetical protein